MLDSQIKEFLRDIRKIETLVIVEGKRDRVILEKLGFRRVMDISGKTLAKVVEEVERKGHKEVIVLTDFDEEGKKKFKLLSKLFQAKRIKINGKLRQKIKFLFRVGKIEELKFYLDFI